MFDIKNFLLIYIYPSNIKKICQSTMALAQDNKKVVITKPSITQYSYYSCVYANFSKEVKYSIIYFNREIR